MMTSSPRGCLMDSLVFLERAQRLKPQPVYVLHGDEDFLKRQVVTALRRIVLGEAAQLLVDLIGSDMGLLEQELAKWAIYVGTATKIESADVDKLVGNSRAENMWKIFDAIGAGRSAEALTILDRLFEQGEEPLRILGAFSMQLRRLAQAARGSQQGQSLGAALDRAGVPPFARAASEQQLRHLGRRRADRLYDWLLETDLGLKGSSQLRPQTLLERLVVQLAR